MPQRASRRGERAADLHDRVAPAALASGDHGEIGARLRSIRPRREGALEQRTSSTRVILPERQHPDQEHGIGVASPHSHGRQGGVGEAGLPRGEEHSRGLNGPIGIVRIEPASRLHVLETGGVPAAQRERLGEQETGAHGGGVGRHPESEERVEHLDPDRHVEKAAGRDELELRPIVAMHHRRAAREPRGTAVAQQEPPEVVTGRIHPQVFTRQVA